MSKYYMIGPFEGDTKINVLVEDITELPTGTVNECKQEFFKCMTDFYIQFDKCYCPKSIKEIDEKVQDVSIIIANYTVSLHVNKNYSSCTKCEHLYKYNKCRMCNVMNNMPMGGLERLIELSYGTSGGLNSGFDAYLIPIDKIIDVKYDYVLKRRHLNDRYIYSDYEISTRAEDRTYDSNVEEIDCYQSDEADDADLREF